MIIAGYLKTSLIEWPGKISSVIFTQGCNFRCGFCHNRDLVDKWMNRRMDKWIKESDVLDDLRKRQKWIDAVVITGGEPTLQDGLIEFIKLIKLIKGMGVMVETNGSRPEVVKRLIENGLVDYWTMDLKSNFGGYEGVVGTGTVNSASGIDGVKGSGDSLVVKIRESIGLIAGSGVEYEFRTTVVPGLHNLENLIQLASEIKSLIHNTQYLIQPRWYLHQFRPVNCLDKSYLKKKPFTEDEVRTFQKELQKIIPQTHLRGV